MYEIILGEIIACVCVMYGLFCMQKYILSNRLIASEQKLRARIATFERNYSDIRADTGGIVSGSIENMGVDGIIDALGIPAMFKPVAKGFIDNLLKDPEKLKELAGKFGVNLDGMSSETSKGPYL